MGCCPAQTWRFAFTTRHTLCQKFSYLDPTEREWLPLDTAQPPPPNHLLLNQRQEASNPMLQLAAVQGRHLSVSFPFAQNAAQVNSEVSCDLVTSGSPGASSARITCLAALEIPGRLTAYITGSADKNIRLCARGRVIRALRGHTESVTALTLLGGTDGPKVLASSSEDTTVRVWSLAPLVPNPNRHPQLATLRGHGDSVTSMCAVEDWARPGSPLLATASRDQKVKLWDVAAACTRGARENTVAACVGSIKLATSASALLPHEGGSSCSVVVVVMEKDAALLDLRTMRLEQTIAACTRGGITCSAAVSGGLQSHLLCTGTRHGVACVWDSRKGSSCAPEASAGPGGAAQASAGVTPVASMNAFSSMTADSPVNHIHIDSHKVITTTSFPRGDECPIKAWCPVTGRGSSALQQGHAYPVFVQMCVGFMYGAP
ncbi:hypothetical protein CYMTET_18086 [Cymbomonas tetramitiformis]|uniref:Uncharacterized protein n=1 Tax=Cymbomonas tetramitiformis TaxID=36881 RepID=A0AAE0G990_9CHLO|nr:hypothetical protein CYMTET_18086 [Cymbomonas tetramitiformis]